MRFAATSEVLVPFLKNRSREDMVEEVKRVKFTGQNTKIASAVEIALDELDRARRKDATQAGHWLGLEDDKILDCGTDI